MPEPVIIISVVAVCVTVIAMIVGAVLDDLREIHQRQAYKKHPYASRYRTRPIVTILLISDSSLKATEQTVRHLRKSTYRRLEIIIIRKAQNKRLTRSMNRLSTKTRPVIVAASSQTGSSAINNTYRRHGHGDIVVTLKDTDRLDKSAINRVVWYFASQKNLSKLSVRASSLTYDTVTILLQTYLQKISFLWQKSMTSFAITESTDSSIVSFYKSDIFCSRDTASIGQRRLVEDVFICRPIKAAYRHLLLNSYKDKQRQLGAFTSNEHRKSIRERSALYRVANFILVTCALYLVVALPFLLTFTIFFALVLHQPLLFFITLVVVYIFILLGIWSDKAIPLSRKIMLSLLAPMSFLPLYLLSWIYSVATLIAALNILWVACSRSVTGLYRTTVN